MRQSKTTIKELTSQYRAVLKHAFLAGIAAVAVSTSGAMAAGQFEGDVKVNTTDGEENVYTVGTIDTINTMKPDALKIEYQDKDGNTVHLNSDGSAATGATESDYTGTSAVDGTNVTTTQKIEHDKSIQKSNYKFVSTSLALSGDEIQFETVDGVLKAKTADGTTDYSDTEPTGLTGKITLTNKSITVDADTVTAGVVVATEYDIEINGVTYHLNADATKLLDSGSPANDVTASFGTEFNTLKGQYATDTAKVNAAIEAITAANTKNSNNYNAAKVAYGKDKTTIDNLTEYYGTLTDALDDLQNAKTAYSGSLGEAVDKHILDATVKTTDIQEAAAAAATGDTSKMEALISDEKVVSSKVLANIVSEKEANLSEQLGYDVTKNPANKEAEGSLVNALTMNKNAEGETVGTVSSVVGAINANTDAIAALQLKDNQLRNDINALDSKVNELDENLSAGIASSVALSSVAVANVQRGEMSVGGGYGNYNSKSAVAFGAALGITDNWSANAGVGLGFGSDTKASFRVGTNYKFKLF